MKRSEAKQLIVQILRRATYSRSNITESLMGHGSDLGKIEKNVMNHIDPYLFPQDESYDALGIVQIASRLQSKGDNISPMDLYNLLTLVHESETLKFALTYLDKVQIPDISLLPKWVIAGFENDQPSED